MTPHIFCLLSSILLLLTSATLAERVVYSIETTWDGQPITDHDFATVALDVNEDGDLLVEASAPFANSPIPPEALVVADDQCPQRPHGQLYNYEVVEAFFLNDEDEYLELEFSPQGLYLFIMLDGYRNDVLSLLPLMPQGIAYSNPCADSPDTECRERWTTTAVIPRDYLPASITKFNAYAIHGEPYGDPSPSDIFYESLYPADPDLVEQPDFHYLDGFGDIDLVGEVGYAQPEEKSQLWAEATDGGSGSYVFNYDMTLTDFCDPVPVPTPSQYTAVASTDKSTSDDQLTVKFEVLGGEGYDAFVPESEQTSGYNPDLSTETESVWFSWTAADGAQLRLGFNPFRSQNAIVVSADGQEQSVDLNLFGSCGAQIDPIQNWNCDAFVPFSQLSDLLGGDPVRMQILHVHSTVNAEDGDEPFVAALCPGQLGEGDDPFDWAGCEVDPRSLVG